MLKPLLLISALLLTTTSYAQMPAIYDGTPGDSLVFSFEPADSLQGSNIGHLDTTGTTLWDIGTTSKTYFSSGGSNSYAIMTDTTDTYPTNANDWFTVTASYGMNTIISFRHKYQTTSGRDGGIVEFSFDGGTNWQNVLDSCNADNSSGFGGPGIHTDNFYGKDDTLVDGQWAFSGNSNGWMYSRCQFFLAIPVKTTTTGCLPGLNPMLRFRFVSDDTLETLDGWMIDDIKIENDLYGGNASSVVAGRLNVYPSPSYDGLVNFPVLKREQGFHIIITGITGNIVTTSPYKHTLDLSAQPKGMYYYKVTDGETTYTGRLLME